MQSSPFIISRKNSRSAYESPSSSSYSRYPPNDQNIVLVSQSHALAEALSEVIHKVAHAFEDLHTHTHSDLKAVIIDADYLPRVDLNRIRAAFPTAFLAVYDPSAVDRPVFRAQCFDAGVNMLAHDTQSLLRTLKQAVIPAGNNGGRLSCPYCSLHNLTEQELWYHCPAYHVNWCSLTSNAGQCPICRETVRGPLQVHIHEQHGPNARNRSQSSTARDETPSNAIIQLYNFALVICRHPVTKKYLLCQEFANQGYWCPGGAVDAGETLSSAAVRETMEEAGIEVTLKGILSVEYNPCGTHWRNSNQVVRLRVIFYAEPSSAVGMFQLPKSSPDFESVGACWCSYEEIQSQLKLRGAEPKKWSRYLEEGNPIFPLSLLTEKQG